MGAWLARQAWVAGPVVAGVVLQRAYSGGAPQALEIPQDVAAVDGVAVEDLLILRAQRGGPVQHVPPDPDPAPVMQEGAHAQGPPSLPFQAPPPADPPRQ